MRAARTAVAALVAVCVLVTSAAAGGGSVIEPPKRFERDIVQMRTSSGIDVYLPSRLRVRTSARRVRALVRRSTGRWDLELGIGRDCHVRTSCYLANFSGTRGLEPAFTRRVRLARGHTGYWQGTECAASCSPPVIQWVHRGVLYEIASRDIARKGQKAKLVSLANSAIKAGPR